MLSGRSVRVPDILMQRYWELDEIADRESS
jgi:hypothetical protein